MAMMFGESPWRAATRWFWIRGWMSQNDLVSTYVGCLTLTRMRLELPCFALNMLDLWMLDFFIIMFDFLPDPYLESPIWQTYLLQLDGTKNITFCIGVFWCSGISSSGLDCQRKPRHHPTRFFWRGARKSSQDDINSTYTWLFFIFQRSQKCIDKIHRWSGGVCFEPLKSYQTMDSPQVLGGLGKCWRSPATDPTDSKQFKLFGNPARGIVSWHTLRSPFWPFEFSGGFKF